MPIGSIISGLFGAHSNSQAIDAQKEENQKTREYNLSLARLQNQWNVDQWQRENEYNSPSAQMARFKAAGLNPDLIYGQSNTGGQISGSLSSGAPANPADIGSLLSQKGNNISKAYGALGDAMMELPLYREELRSRKIDNDLKQEQLNRNKSDNSFTEFLRSYNPDGDILSPEWTKFVNSISGKRTLNELDSTWYQVQKDSAEYSYLSEEANVRRINALIQGELYNQIRSFAKDLDISQDDAETFVRSMFYAARGIKADALFKEGEAVWNDPSFLEKLPAGLPKIMMFLRSLLK